MFHYLWCTVLHQSRMDFLKQSMSDSLLNCFSFVIWGQTSFFYWLISPGLSDKARLGWCTCLWVKSSLVSLNHMTILQLRWGQTNQPTPSCLRRRAKKPQGSATRKKGNNGRNEDNICLRLPMFPGKSHASKWGLFSLKGSALKCSHLLPLVIKHFSCSLCSNQGPRNVSLFKTYSRLEELYVMVETSVRIK